MGKPLFKLCPPCCNNCPVFERSGALVVIHDPERPERGRIEVPLHTIECLLDLEDGASEVDLVVQPLVLFMGRRLTVRLEIEDGKPRVDLKYFEPTPNRFSTFTFHTYEWDALFASDENRRLALEALRRNEPIELKPVPAARAT